MQPLDVDSHGERNVNFSDGTKQGTEVNHPINAHVYNQLLQVLEVQNVCILIGTYEGEKTMTDAEFNISAPKILYIFLTS